MKAVRIANIITFIVLLIGGINWLSIGIFDFNLVTAISFGMIAISRIIYILVGISAIWLIISAIWTKHIGFPTNSER